MRKKILVGMSGGVDSSVTAFLLKEQGYDVSGFTMINYDKYNSEEAKESSKKDLEDAKSICRGLGIEHIAVDFKKDFSLVVDYFISEYKNGKTPSPCIICDEKIKFGVFIEYMKKNGFDYLSTGHYVDTAYSEKFNKKLMKKSKDELKDQTYMLYRVSPDIFDYTVFPLKDYSKEEIRSIAEKNNLITYNKKDSQGICFAKDGYIKILKEILGKEIGKGNFTDKDGKIIGEHEGYYLYTKGQRRGLGLDKGHAYFITEIIVKENRVVLGEYKELYEKSVKLRDFKLYVEKKDIENLEIIAKPRFSSKGLKAKINFENNEVEIIYIEENTQNSPGQHLVLYYDDFVLGGGIII